MNNEGVIIYTIGVGSSMGSNIIDPATGQPKTDVQGNVVVTKLINSIMLDGKKGIAEKCNIKYLFYFLQ